MCTENTRRGGGGEAEAKESACAAQMHCAHPSPLPPPAADSQNDGRTELRAAVAAVERARERTVKMLEGRPRSPSLRNTLVIRSCQGVLLSLANPICGENPIPGKTGSGDEVRSTSPSTLHPARKHNAATVPPPPTCSAAAARSKGPVRQVQYPPLAAKFPAAGDASLCTMEACSVAGSSENAACAASARSSPPRFPSLPPMRHPQHMHLHQQQLMQPHAAGTGIDPVLQGKGAARLDHATEPLLR